jgi:hypothetical protein
MPLHSADMLEETPATQLESAPIASNQPDSLALAEMLPDLSGDTIQLLLQSPHKLFLYWNLAIDPATTLREAFGELAARYRLMVRLVKVESGEEFLLEAMPERRQWFEVYPHHAYRADVGFHAENRPSSACSLPMWCRRRQTISRKPSMMRRSFNSKLKSSLATFAAQPMNAMRGRSRAKLRNFHPKARLLIRATLNLSLPARRTRTGKQTNTRIADSLRVPRIFQSHPPRASALRAPS